MKNKISLRIVFPDREIEEAKVREFSVTKQGLQDALRVYYEERRRILRLYGNCGGNVQLLYDGKYVIDNTLIECALSLNPHNPQEELDGYINIILHYNQRKQND